MIINVRSYTSPDIENIWAWAPSREEVYALLEFEVGSDEAGADIFSCVIATPEALRLRERPGTTLLSARATVVVSDFVWSEVQAYVEKTVGQCAGRDWASTVTELQKYFAWEYESA